MFQHADAHGHQVVLVARGPHRDAIRANGLTINDFAGSVSVNVPVVEHIDEVPLQSGDLVVLAMKTQDTSTALEQLVRHAPNDINVACAQNGVESERLALRRFANVYGVCVMLPASFLQPGVVDASGAPHNAILDIGRYPTGTDDTSDAIAAAFTASDLVSTSRPDVMRWKYSKLTGFSVSNVIDALVADPENSAVLLDAARREADACLAAAGITKVTPDEEQARRTGAMETRPLLAGNRRRAGGSTWQSFARGAGSNEVDWLNGEVVLLGRLHGVPTPINAVLCDVAKWAAATGAAPRSITTAQILARSW
ncbi:MAG: 2-dehydropantoate 2-reductase [Ilumatobacteraceae bacterium]|nr:2-dehydropantoate 2-reductase [Ilumatobacteraceae bacterium]